VKRAYATSKSCYSVLVLFCICLAVSASGQTPTTELLDDGPHVYLQSPSSATIFYLCDGEVSKREFENLDTIRFQGFCHDTLSKYTVPLQEHKVQPHLFTDVSRIFAVSDLHGEYEAFTDLLIKSGVVDKTLHWNWGDGHLVIVGDVFDRGDRVTECLWLIYRLQQEAPQHGGRVHYILGNHDTMVLRGDLRYVNDKYLKGVVRKTKISYPDLFGPEMELGRWLRTMPTLVKLNYVLFVHGGISPAFIDSGKDMTYVNNLVRSSIDFRTYRTAFDEELQDLFGSKGPFWYRGLVTENRYPRATQDEVERVLEFYGAESMVVGHTEVEQVTSFYGGLVTAIDVPLEDLGSLQGYLREDNIAYRVTGEGERERLN